MAPRGGIFDFNWDGKVSWSEQWTGIRIINECMKSEQEEQRRSQSSYNTYAGLFDTAPSQADVSDDGDWRLFCEDGSDYGIDPDDYDSEEEYEEVLELAQMNADASHEPVAITINITYPGQEALEAIKREVYPDERSFEAARYLCDLEQGTAWLLEDTDVEAEKERCRLILDRPCLAARYLTAYNGYILAQAVRDHFILPIDVAEENTEIKLHIDDLVNEVAEEDPALALEIWGWCIKEFGPYRKYLQHSWSLYNGILGNLNEYPEEFRALVIKKLGTDTDFAEGILTENPDIPYRIADCIAIALENGDFQEAQVMFVATVTNSLLKGKDIESIINSVLSGIYNYKELESMERFQEFLMPIIKKINNKRIRRLIPKFQQTITDYINFVEGTAEKYQYSRRYAWRKTCADGTPFDLDPLDFETEDEYNKAIQDEKYGWRRWHSEDSRYGLDVNAFETEDAYEKALHEKQAIERQERLAQRQAAYIDPLAGTDKTVYSFCGVSFGEHTRPYYYLTGNVEVEIGDRVEVPSSRLEGRNVGTVVSVSKHLRASAPFPVDRAKTILRKLL